MIRIASFFLFTLFLSVYYVPMSPLARAQSVNPPDIRNVQITNVAPDSVTITWETDKNADSTVNYGLQEDYGIVRIPTPDRRQHEITLTGLEQGRTYFFRVVSSDEDGNQGISANYKVVTDGSSDSGSDSGEGPGQGQGTSSDINIEEIIEQIQQIQSAETLQEILNEIVKAVQGITEDLTIVGPPTVIPETTSALISWTTDREASSEVLFSPSRTFTEGQYQFSQTSTGADTRDHEIRIIGLEPFTEYSFQVRSVDTFGIVGSSRNYTFRTKASLPDIRNLRIVKVEEDSATLAWDTTVPAKALIEFQDMSTGGQNSVGRPTLASSHQMRISDLRLGTRYVAFVIAENAGGDRVRSNPITFVTVRDTAPPIISNVTNESTIFPGGESRIQTIIEWLTDEPALCTLTFREGIAGGVEPTTIDARDNTYAMKHVEVIVDFAPATVYQFWIECEDNSGNEAKSENFVLFTPIQEKNIIDIIIENFESTFGWVKNITG